MKKGFTLIELLIVIAIIAILAGVVFVALDPGKRFADARNSARWTDVTAILSAIKVDQVDNGGSYLASISGLVANTNFMIGTATGATVPPCGNANCTLVPAGNCVNLTGLETEGYLGKIPVSPSAGTISWSVPLTGYYLSKSDKGVITIAACSAERADGTVSATDIVVKR